MSAQDALFAIPNVLHGWWWLLCAVFALPAAVFMFLYMLMNHPFNGLWMARATICLGLACFGLSPLNSGFVPWGALITSIGGLYTVFLIATDWCTRQDKWEVLREMLLGRRQEAHDAKGSARDRRSGAGHSD